MIIVGYDTTEYLKREEKYKRIICKSENQEKFQILVEVVFFFINEILIFNNSTGNYCNFLLFIL